MLFAVCCCLLGVYLIFVFAVRVAFRVVCVVCFVCCSAFWGMLFVACYSLFVVCCSLICCVCCDCCWVLFVVCCLMRAVCSLLACWLVVCCLFGVSLMLFAFLLLFVRWSSF